MQAVVWSLPATGQQRAAVTSAERLRLQPERTPIPTLKSASRQARAASQQARAVVRCKSVSTRATGRISTKPTTIHLTLPRPPLQIGTVRFFCATVQSYGAQLH